MAQLKKMARAFIVPFFLLLSGCGNMYLTSPYIMNGDVQLFLDGKLVASGNFDRPFGADMSNYVYRIESGDDPVDGLGQIYVLERVLSWKEIQHLSESYTNAPSNPGIIGDYPFNGDLDSGPYAFILSSAVIINGTNPNPYDLFYGAMSALAPEANTIVELDPDVLPPALDDLAINFWYREEAGNSEPVNLFTLSHPGSGSDPEINLFIEPGGNIVLALDTNWSKIVYNPGPGFDYSDKHMITVRFRN